MCKVKSCYVNVLKVSSRRSIVKHIAHVCLGVGDVHVEVEAVLVTQLVEAAVDEPRAQGEVDVDLPVIVISVINTSPSLLVSAANRSIAKVIRDGRFG